MKATNHYDGSDEEHDDGNDEAKSMNGDEPNHDKNKGVRTVLSVSGSCPSVPVSSSASAMIFTTLVNSAQRCKPVSLPYLYDKLFSLGFN